MKILKQGSVDPPIQMNSGDILRVQYTRVEPDQDIIRQICEFLPDKAQTVSRYAVVQYEENDSSLERFGMRTGIAIIVGEA